MASVKVAVRVRPFNEREKNLSAKRIIEMIDKKTKIYDKNGQKSSNCKEFTFDYSYWSFDDCDSHFTTQEQVFDDLGNDVVGSAFEGYNACVFAYGQTGSGKTYTMMGSPENQGLIPRICEALFNHMTLGSSYRIEVSYLEIYNEKVKDLLKPELGTNLKIREHPTLGPVIQELSKHLVTEYSHIQALMGEGNALRKTANTKMNDSSSRSHAIFTIMFVQAGMCNDLPTETVSKIHLVDLAGSERADATEAAGERLREGAHINKSLVTLGSVISALSELSAEGGYKKIFIPYRNSILTWLLKDSLGGNSKTIMIAAISPADCNYNETLSTLRYANRAKNIINKPTVNEDPNVKLIRELRAEIVKLKSLISTDYVNGKRQVLKKELHKKEEEEKFLTEKWAKKWQETQVILREQEALALRKAGTGVVLDSDRPHLICIDDNLLSTGVTLYHLLDGETLIGTKDAKQKQHIVLSGDGMRNEHCSILLKDGEATLVPKGNALCWVNGQSIDTPTTLFQGCIIMVGQTNMFRYNDPVQAEKMRKEGDVCRSHLNLSRISMMTWSTPDLAHSFEGTGCSVSFGDAVNQEKCELNNEEPKQSERKQRRKQLEFLRKRFEEIHQEAESNKETLDRLNTFAKSQMASFLEKKFEVLQKKMEENLMRNIKDFEKVTLSDEETEKTEEPKNSLIKDLGHITRNVYLEEDVNNESAGRLVSVGQSLHSDWEGNIQSNDDESNHEDDDLTWDCEAIKVIVNRKIEGLKNRLYANRAVTTASDYSNSLERQLHYEDPLRPFASSTDNLVVNEDSISYQPRSVPYPVKATEEGHSWELSVCIPSFVLRGTGNGTHYEYEVVIQTGTDQWTVLRRYSRFRQLHLQMKKKYGIEVIMLGFPPRKPFSRQSEALAKERKPQLELYLKRLFETCSKISSCPLNYSEVTKERVQTFSNFFKRGVFETGKYATS